MPWLNYHEPLYLLPTGIIINTTAGPMKIDRAYIPTATPITDDQAS